MKVEHDDSVAGPSVGFSSVGEGETTFDSIIDSEGDSEDEVKDLLAEDP